METIASTARTTKYMLRISLQATHTDSYTQILYQKKQMHNYYLLKKVMYKSVKRRWQQQ